MLSLGLKRTVLVLMSAFILTGCPGPVYPSTPSRPVTIEGTPEPYPCAHFADAHWQEFRFGVDTQADVIAAAGRMWGIEQEGFHSPEPDNYNPLPRLSWELGDVGVRYFAVFFEDGTLKEIDFLIAPYWQEDNSRGGPALTAEELAANTGSYPTLRQIIACFGAPDMYSAYRLQDVESAQIRFALWYVEEGLVFAHRSWGRHHAYPRPPPFPPELSMHFATMLPAGDAGRMVNARYGNEYQGDRKEYVLCILKAWPGSIEAMGAENALYGYARPHPCEDPTPQSSMIRPNSGRS